MPTVYDIQAKIIKITTRYDRYATPYLLLGTNKGNIFCFSTTVDQSQGKDLNEGQKYGFTVRKSASGVRILTDFDLVETPK